MATITKKTVLKPCPFCGSKAKRSRITDHGPELPKPFWSITCKNHHCSIPCASGDTRQEADRNWNRRRADLSMLPITGDEAVPFIAVCGTLMALVHEIELPDPAAKDFILLRVTIIEGTHFNDRGNFNAGDQVTIGPITGYWRKLSTRD